LQSGNLKFEIESRKRELTGSGGAEKTERDADPLVLRDLPQTRYNTSHAKNPGWLRSSAGGTEPSMTSKHMIMKHKALGLLLVIASFAALLGCNDTLRQFITPVPLPGGDPAALSHAVVLSSNPGGFGSDLHINVSGDSVVGVVSVGPNPVFLGKLSNRAYVINGDDTISTYIALNPLNSQVNTVTLPPGTLGTALGGGSNGAVYVTNGGGTVASNNVPMIAPGVIAVTDSVTVGSRPVAIAGNAANSKIYVLNFDSGTVTPISTTDNAVLPDIPVGTNPIWGVMAPDGVHAFIVNQGSGNVSVIDTLLDKVIATVPVGTTATPSPNYAVFEPTLQRLYVSNTGENTISVIKANGTDLANGILPAKIADVAVSGTPASVTALGDGTRAYVALGNCPAGTNHTNIAAVATTCTGNTVSVIDSASFTEKKIIPVGAGAVSIDSASDSSRVYVVGAIAGNVSVIRPVSDTVVTTLPAPQQSFGCATPGACPNTPQTPFMVRIFP
jgi:YVTN family beta-propeller protein